MKALFLFTLIFLGYGRANALAQYHCEMKWNLLTEGKTEEAFSLESEAKVSPFPHMQVLVNGNKQGSGVKVIQTYGEKEKSHIIYSLSCSGSLNCEGAREEMGDDSKKKETKFSMKLTPHSVVIAMIGQRELFHYRSLKDGFSYRFIQYRLPSGEAAGMELSCHE